MFPSFVSVLELEEREWRRVVIDRRIRAWFSF